jgi:hypothetical protein
MISPLLPPPPPPGRKPSQTKVQKIKQAIQVISQQTKPQSPLPDQKSVDALIGYLTTQTTPLPGAPPVVQKPFPQVTQKQLQIKFLQFLKKLKQQSQKRKTTPPLNPQAAASTIKVLQQKVKQQTQKPKQQAPSSPSPSLGMPPMPPPMPLQRKQTPRPSFQKPPIKQTPRPSFPIPKMPPNMPPKMPPTPVPQKRRST